MACDAQTLINSANTNGYRKLAERDLLACWLAALCTGACDAATLLASATSSGYRKLSERDLWVSIAEVANPTLSTFAIPYDNMASYKDGVLVQGLFGGVNGTSPPIVWTNSYSARYASALPALLVYDNNTDYSDGVAVNGLNGGVLVFGTWTSAYSARNATA